MTNNFTKKSASLILLFFSFTYFLSSCSQTHYPMARVEKKNIDKVDKLNIEPKQKINEVQPDVTKLEQEKSSSNSEKQVIASSETSSKSQAIASASTTIAEQKTITQSAKQTWKEKILKKKINRILEKNSAPAIQKGSYLYIGIVLVLVGLVIGLVFGSLGYLLVVIGIVVALIGLLTNN